MSLILVLDSPDVEGAVATGQDGQTAAAQGGLQFIAAVATGQGAQTIDASELELFIGVVDTGQAAQTIDGSENELFIGVVDLGQAAQSIDLQAVRSDVAPVAPNAFGPGGYEHGPIVYRKRAEVQLPWPREAAVETAQAAQETSAIGWVKPGFKAAAATEQAAAEVIVIGTVDNRKPNNRRKAKLAALLLAA